MNNRLFDHKLVILKVSTVVTSHKYIDDALLLVLKFSATPGLKNKGDYVAAFCRVV